MKKNKLTDLDKILRQKLQDESILNNDWNTPSDDLFFAAMEAIDEKNNSKRKGIYWLSLGGVILLLLLVVGFNYWNTIGDIPGQTDTKIAIHQIGDEIDNNKTLGPATQPSDIENKKEYQEELVSRALRNGAEISVESNLNNNRKMLKEKYFVDLTTESINKERKIITTNPPIKLYNRSFSQNTITLDKQSTILASSNKVSKEANYNTLNEKVVDAQLPIRELQKVTQILTWSLNKDVQGVTPPDHTVNKQIQLYALAGVNFSALHMRPATAIGYSLEKYDSRYRGNHYALGVQQRLGNRWSLNYQLNYTRLNNISIHKDFQSYNEENEFVDEYGNELYHTNARIISPTTDFECELDLDFSKEMLDDEIIEQITTIDQAYSIVGISVLPEYALLSDQKWIVSATAGIELNYIRAFRQDMELKMMAHNEIMVRETMEDTEVAKLNRFYSGASLGLNVRYNWTDRWSSSLQTNAMTSLNSIKQNEDGVNTHISDLRISFKTSYAF